MKNILKEVDYKLITVTSPSFKDNDHIPVQYTCDGRNISPALKLEHIPTEAMTLAIIVEDPDAPAGTWVHWVVWNIPVTHMIRENEIHGLQGVNDFGKNSYGGPCPPSGTHRYFFKVYALDSALNLPSNTRKIELEKAMSTHILGFGELVGLYTRQ